MPSVNIGQKIQNIDDRNPFIQLKSKDEKLHFRLVQIPYSYTAKHILLNELGNYDVSDCERILNGGHCDKCDKYFELKESIKNEENEKVKKTLENQAKNFAPKMTFYYAVINREIEKAQIFKTSLSVRIAIDNEQKILEKFDGTVYEYDYIVERTEQPGAGYYKLTRLDSKQTKEFTEQELEEYDIAKGWDLEEKVNKSKKTSKTEEFNTEEKPTKKTENSDVGIDGLPWEE